MVKYWCTSTIRFTLNLTNKRIKAEKNGDKDRKKFYKLVSNVLYSKRIENMRNGIHSEFVSWQKDYLKGHKADISQKVFSILVFSIIYIY